VEIPAGVLEGSDIIEGIVFENGAATQINIAAGALKNCAVLASVEVKNSDAKVAIGKAAFEGCAKLNSVCEAEQTVESDAGKVTLAKGANAMIGTMLVKADADEDADIKAKIETNYAEFDTPTVAYYDLSLKDIHGNTVESKAADVAMAANIPATAWHIYIYHNTGSTVESFRINEENSTVTADKLTEVCFHVDSLSPFATAYCPGTPYHDDMFWYELTRDEEDKVTGAVITGIYGGQEDDETPAYTGTTLEFSGKTRDDKEYPVTAIKSEAFKNNTTITTAVFTNENELGVGEDAFSGCTALANVIVDGKLGLVDSDLFENAGTVALIKVPDSLPKNALTGNKPETIYFGSAIGDGAAAAIANVPKGKTVYVNANKDECPGAAKLDELLAAKEGNAPQVFYLNSNEEKGELFIAGTPVTPEVKDETTGEVISGPDGSKTAPFNTFAQLSGFMGGKGGKDGADEEVLAPEIASKLQPILTAAKITHTVPKTFKKTLTGTYTVYVLNAVKVTGTEEWDGTLTDDSVIELYRDPEFTGEMVNVTGALTLKNVVLDGNKDNVEATEAMIKSSGTLNIHEGAIIRNNNRAEFGYPDKAGGIYASGAVNMDGGEISGNTGVYGGGIQICGSGAVFNMTGGRITGNRTIASKESYGGGVNVGSGATMNLSGGVVEKNEVYGVNSAVGGHGGGIAVGADVSGMCQGARLVMTGGKVDGNVSAESGGGIFVQTNCTANITAGQITNNTCNGGEYGGGGIYVNGVRDDTQDGRLYMSHVLITGNSADVTGGGYAGCATSTAYFYMGNGAALYGNTAGDNSDLHIGTEAHQTAWGMQIGVPFAYVSQYMFNGTEYNWKNVKTGEACTPAQLANIDFEASLRAYPDGTQPTIAAVIITGNHSATKAGGVGSNGFVSIGDKPSAMDVKWTPEVDKILYNRDMKPGETFTFTVYEEKTGVGQPSFWYTAYEDVKVGTGSVTGGKDGQPAAIVFSQIDLGRYTADQIGSTRTFLIVEDAPQDPKVIAPRMYAAITIIIGTRLVNNEVVLTAEILKNETGRIDDDGYFEYEDTLDGSVGQYVTPTNNFGRIREKTDRVVFENYSTETSVCADKTWLNHDGGDTPPTGAKATLELYADGVATGKTVELDGVADEGLTAASLTGEFAGWRATWKALPAYRTNDKGELLTDDDVERLRQRMQEI
ncbi:MAG: leucine-rich repeat protein, partial [Clostridia bacterium]|nr:leucine-rich repeat protein [Clostridia bacterium]